MNSIITEPRAFGEVMVLLQKIRATEMEEVCPGDAAVAGKEPTKLEYMCTYLSGMEDEFFDYLKKKYADAKEVAGCFVNVDMFVKELHNLGFCSDDSSYAGFLAHAFYSSVYPCDMNFSIKDIVEIVMTEV